MWNVAECQAPSNPGPPLKPEAALLRLIRRVGVTAVKTLASARKKLMETCFTANPFRRQAADIPLKIIEVESADSRPEATDGFVRRDASERLDNATFIDGRSM